MSESKEISVKAAEYQKAYIEKREAAQIKYGATPEGAGWRIPASMDYRAEKLANVLRHGDLKEFVGTGRVLNIVDVGGAFGGVAKGMLDFLEKQGVKAHYTSVDFMQSAVDAGTAAYKNTKYEDKVSFICGNYLDIPTLGDLYVCSGVFTDSTTFTPKEFKAIIEANLSKMYSEARLAVKFNLANMSVDYFERANMYMSPFDALALATKYSSKVVIDHSVEYQLFEMFVTIYKDEIKYSL